MELEEGLTAVLETAIGSGKVHPLHADKDEATPYAVYLQTSGSEYQSLSGYEGLHRAGYEINILHSTYTALKTLSASVDTALKALQGTTCGAFLIQEIDVDENSPELYEAEVKLFRKIINIEIIY